jgi:SNF2 family DNA or RNA helicase
MLNTNLKIDFNPKTQKLIAQVPFHLNDVIRAFPSRRFDPKTKKWTIPLVKSNVDYLTGLTISGIEFTSAAEQAIKDIETITAPPVHIPFARGWDFNGKKPFEHQWWMLDLAWNLKAAAWICEMGTGKTFAAAHLAMARFWSRQIDGVVVICPSTLRKTWEKELAKYIKLPYDFRIHQTKAGWYDEWCANADPNCLKILAVSGEGLGVSEQLYDSVCKFFIGRRVLAIADESSLFKNPKALRTNRAISLGAVSQYRMILNGTPIALGIHDLWAQYEFLDPNILGMGDYWAFKTRYVETGGYENKQIVGFKNVQELMDKVKPFSIEVRKKDVMKDLPEKVYKDIFIEATPEQRALFHQITKQGGVGHEGQAQIKVDNTLERMLRLRQVTGGYLPEMKPTGRTVVDKVSGEIIPEFETIIKPLAKNPKFDALMTFVEEHHATSKFIIFSTFVHEIEDMASRLGDKYGPRTVETYYGKTPMDKRSEIEDRYCRDPQMRFFIANPVAAGKGLTLISGENDVMVYYSGTNAFIDRSQSEDRAHRIGQKNSVVVCDLVVEKSVDEVIKASIEMKMDVDRYVRDQLAAGTDIIKVLSGEASWLNKPFGGAQ